MTTVRLLQIRRRRQPGDPWSEVETHSVSIEEPSDWRDVKPDGMNRYRQFRVVEYVPLEPAQVDAPVSPAEPVERDGEASAFLCAYRDVAALADERRRALGPNDYSDGLDRACEALDSVFRSRPAAHQQAVADSVLAGRVREGRQLLARFVKYVRAGRAEKLALHTEAVADYLERTWNPRDILRAQEDEVAVPAGAVDEREALLSEARRLIDDMRYFDLSDTPGDSLNKEATTWLEKFDARKGTP